MTITTDMCITAQQCNTDLDETWLQSSQTGQTMRQGSIENKAHLIPYQIRMASNIE